ncbi:MAG TPA: hypothetical protein VGC30_07920, partial [Dokdonella sp.]
PASRFDPQRDTIVRVEARRLRARLARYYRDEGAGSLVEIALPIGGYTVEVRRRTDDAGTASLAILPVDDRSGAVIAPAFRDDLLDALLDATSRIPGFKVIARTSAMRAAAATDDGAEPVDDALAQRLGVALLLHGTLDRDETRMRLKLRLVRAAGAERMWTGSWTLSLEGGFGERDAVTAQVVADVQAALLAAGVVHREIAPPTPRPSSPPIDDRARDLVDRGLYLMRYGTVDAYPQALARFRSAAAIEPRYAAAHFGMARSLSYLLGMTQIEPAPGVDEARRAAGEALALDPLHGDAASLLAAIRQRFDHDWPAAQAGYLAAIALAPGSLYVHFNYAFGLMFSGRYAEAEAEAEARPRARPARPRATRRRRCCRSIAATTPMPRRSSTRCSTTSRATCWRAACAAPSRCTAATSAAHWWNTRRREPARRASRSGRSASRRPTRWPAAPIAHVPNARRWSMRSQAATCHRTSSR